MQIKVIYIGSLLFLLNGCSQIMPYKTKFDCNAEPTGNCGSLTDNISAAYSMAGITRAARNREQSNISYEINHVTLGVSQRSGNE